MASENSELLCSRLFIIVLLVYQANTDEITLLRTVKFWFYDEMRVTQCLLFLSLMLETDLSSNFQGIP